jgi:hypothetical protein
VALVEGVAAGEHRQADGGGAEAGEPVDGAVDEALGVLEGGSRREHQHLTTASGLEQPGVEAAAVGELATADQRKRSRHAVDPSDGCAPHRIPCIGAAW